MDKQDVLEMSNRELDKALARFMGYEVYEFVYELDGYVVDCYTLKKNGETFNPLEFSRSLALTHLALLEVEKRGLEKEFVIQLLHVLFPGAGIHRFRSNPLSNKLCWEVAKAPPDARCRAVLLASLTEVAA